jgi:alcohol dehydrogenase (cytochrome c)
MKEPYMNATTLTRPFSFGLLLTGTAILLQAASGAGSEWTTPGGTLEGTRFSTLAQITDQNVAGLIEEFNFSTGSNGYLEGQPLVVNNTMYVVGPFPNRLFALDLTQQGKTRWVFTPQVSQFAMGQACCGISSRGAAYSSSSSNTSGKNLVIYATLDNQVIAVDAASGSRVWRTSMGSPHTGQTMTGAAFVVNSNGTDIVIVGNAGAELGVRGWVAALNAGTGAKLWQFYNTGTDADVGIDSTFAPYYAKDQGPNLGATTWPGTLYMHGGSVVWNWFTYDSLHDLLFYGTAQPAPWDAEMRVNPAGNSDNKWSSSIVARSPGTGKAVWAYQLTPHDNWDFDSISESIVATIANFNNGAPFLAHFDKNGFGYTIDAKTGKVLVANPFVPVNWATGVDLATGQPNIVASKTTQEGIVTPDICPSPFGGKNHHPAAFSPVTGLFYVPANNTCVNFQALKVNYIQATPFMGAALSFAAAPNVATFGSGRLIAWDPTTGTEKWGIAENYPYVSGVLATQGNVVFYGTVDGYFKAVNATTGQVLFSKQYPEPISGNAMTFLGADGKQRVAVYTGLARNLNAIPPAPSTFKASPGTVHVFKLP